MVESIIKVETNYYFYILANGICRGGKNVMATYST